MTDLMEFFAVQPKVLSKPGALAAPRPIRRGFEFRNVSFSYPGNTRAILTGERTAILPFEHAPPPSAEKNHVGGGGSGGALTTFTLVAAGTFGSAASALFTPPKPIDNAPSEAPTKSKPRSPIRPIGRVCSATPTPLRIVMY